VQQWQTGKEIQQRTGKIMAGRQKPSAERTQGELAQSRERTTGVPRERW